MKLYSAIVIYTKIIIYSFTFCILRKTKHLPYILYGVKKVSCNSVSGIVIRIQCKVAYVFHFDRFVMRMSQVSGTRWTNLYESTNSKVDQSTI